VVEREVVVAELVQLEQVDGGRDAAAAVTDDALVLRDPARAEFGLGVGLGGEVLRARIHERRGGNVDAARHAALTAGSAPVPGPSGRRGARGDTRTRGG